MNQSGDNRPTIYLVRHTEVDRALKGVCYGRSDVSLSPDGEAAIAPLAENLAALSPAAVFHSGLTRARVLAEALAQRTNLVAQLEPRLIELDFGRWELRRWDDIFTEVGHDIMRLVNEPETFAPPHGETVNAMADRASAWLQDQRPSGPIVAVCHGGPISALLGRQAGLPASRWSELIPAYGAVTRI